MQRVLFVCLGNICRSPLAEGIFSRQAAEAGIAVEADSAGTGDWHVGQRPDARAIAVGEAHGCRMNMRARQFQSSDFQEFDLILAMDRSNLQDLLTWRGSVKDNVHLIRDFDSGPVGAEVPDPYYGSLEDFEEVANMLETACEGLLNSITSGVKS